MSKQRIFLWLIISSIIGILGNVIASGLERKYDLVNDYTRWVFVLIAFAISFLLLVWLEHKRSNKKEGTSINRLTTRFGAKTGKITMKSSGTPEKADTNVIDLGPRSQTEDIKLIHEGEEPD